MRRIVVFTHPEDSFDGRYFLRGIADRWAADGIETIVVKGGGETPDADLAILHCDVTVAPPDLLDAVQTYPIAINARVGDVSKKSISRQLVRDPMDFDGPVVVKCNWNASGWREANLLRTAKDQIGARLEIKPYRVYDCALDVPESDWADPDRVVEKFTPEVHDGLFATRLWIFLGDKETNRVVYSNEPIVKLKNTVRRESDPHVPDAMRVRREELGFDYGKFDYVVVDGEAILLDANPTPMIAGGAHIPALQGTVTALAEGLTSIIDRASNPDG